MRRVVLPALCAALLLAAPSAGADAGKARTLEGEYRSGYGNGSVRVRFTPDGDRQWKVTFDFVFNGRQRTYEGTAGGSFAEGEIHGRVQNRYRRRTFTFRCEYEDGVLRGRHAEVKRGREVPTGTIHLKG